MNHNPLYIAGVVADTHIPDRVSEFHPGLLPLLRKHNVHGIYHAGDISTPGVLTALQEIAPVTAVCGNRDWLLRGSLPTIQNFEIYGVKIALLHGHINLGEYLKDKLYHLTRGYNLERYLPRLLNACPEANIIVFGHTHQPEIIQFEGRLLFNPGSCNTGPIYGSNPHFGILRIYSDTSIEAEIIELTGYRFESRKWVEANLDE
jgi:putative phosphoesterase